MRVFYGVHLQSSKLSSALDVVRYIGEPDNIRFSHITMRGPYSKSLPTTTLKHLNEGRQRRWVVRLDGAGSFISDLQNTIIIKVDLMELEDLVHKPDFVEGIPHLTLYDGDDRDFAHDLLHLFYKYDFHEEFAVNQMQKLSAKAPVRGNFSLLYQDFHECYRKYLNSEPSTDYLIGLSQVKKISFIENILDDNFRKKSDKLRRLSNEPKFENLSFDFKDKQ